MDSNIPEPWGNGPVVTCGKDFVGGWEYLLLALKTNDDYNGDEEQLLSNARSLYTGVIEDLVRVPKSLPVKSNEVPFLPNALHCADQQNKGLCVRCLGLKLDMVHQPKSSIRETLASTSTELGTLSDLISSSSRCQLCLLFLESITEYNNSQVLPTRINGAEVLVQANRVLFCQLEDTFEMGVRCFGEEISRLHVVLYYRTDSTKAWCTEMRHMALFHPYREPFPGEQRLSKELSYCRLLGNYAQSKLLKDWLRQCEEQHDGDCSESWHRGVEEAHSLRVIDVTKFCVVEAPPRCRYFALSYVWGTSWTFRCTTEIATGLHKENSLRDFDIPITIRDAMNLVSRAGEKYLWVDAVCIIQDDELDKFEQIKQMDRIYSRATATLIAAGGHGLSSGIPGMRNESRVIYQGPVKIDKNLYLKKLVEHSKDGQTGHSLWNTRAWTFQEEVLSRRTIIFTRAQTYWTCGTSSWSEEMIPSSIVGPEASERFPREFSMEAFSRYVTEYSSRHLTLQEDALFAISAVLRRIGFLNNVSFHWGLPHLHFGKALCWRGTKVRREAACQIVTEKERMRYVPFPSWSWLGWVGPITFLSLRYGMDGQWSKQGIYPEILFYKLGVDGSTQEIVQHPDSLVASDVSHDILDSHPEDGFDALRRQWSGPRTVARKIIVQSSTRSKSQPLTETNPESTAMDPFEDTGRIVFWTSHARITRRAIDGNAQGEDYILRGEDEDVTGFPEGTVLDVIVVSRERKSQYLDLLIIDWSETEENVAMRVGHCRVYEEDWVKVERTWRMVILE
ncbi:hypothetical protein GLAREA_11698 [Glarea lozoyensis ATCC 20868]|uniref:Heterokaryon incompatibility domain-containing protein n=1 Tax=Glarea lozoyensis (strain ATCC 20868 / MF5171) TaxID=1116229 RepID=S3CF39_GLAL2|nr:uncharacterized protein GLAREA_11698 [Glarea lozoyensis ATCC 20868]EPE25117.1 hypothetical protein GLAREA_11698 [Glarea lozoyensis ATCC 20868]